MRVPEFATPSSGWAALRGGTSNSGILSPGLNSYKVYYFSKYTVFFAALQAAVLICILLKHPLLFGWTRLDWPVSGLAVKQRAIRGRGIGLQHFFQFLAESFTAWFAFAKGLQPGEHSLGQVVG